MDNIDFDRIFTNDNKDTNLINKLTTDEELSGLLKLDLIAPRQTDGFIHTDDIETVRREYKLNSDTVEKFLADQCVVDLPSRERYEICRDIYNAYVLYCRDNRFTPLSDNSFGMELAQKHIRKERRMVKGYREYCYIGIRLTNDVSSLSMSM